MRTPSNTGSPIVSGRLLMLGCALGSALGCGGADATSMVKVQAAQDFVCVESTVDVRRQIDGSYIALGCGKRGVYHAACDGMYCTVSKSGDGFHSPPPRGLPSDPPTMGP